MGIRQDLFRKSTLLQHGENRLKGPMLGAGKQVGRLLPSTTGVRTVAWAQAAAMGMESNGWNPRMWKWGIHRTWELAVEEGVREEEELRVASKFPALAIGRSVTTSSRADLESEQVCSRRGKSEVSTGLSALTSRRAAEY